VQVYHRLPVLNALHATQAPMLVADDRNGLLHLRYPAGLLVGHLRSTLLATVKAGQGAYAELGCGGQWKFLSPFVAGNEE
jgi:hypothetical protein